MNLTLQMPFSGDGLPASSGDLARCVASNAVGA